MKEKNPFYPGNPCKPSVSPVRLPDFYILEVYSPVACDTIITGDIQEKESLVKIYRNCRVLAGPFHTQEKALEFVPEAKRRQSAWNATSPMFYAPPPEQQLIRSIQTEETRVAETVAKGYDIDLSMTF